MNKLIPTAFLACGIAVADGCGDPGTARSDLTDAADMALLDDIINEEIEQKQQILVQMESKLAAVEMTAMGSDRAAAHMAFITREIGYLTELRDNGTMSAKRSYCTMILDRHITILRFETRYRTGFGEEDELLPSEMDAVLSDADVEAGEARLAFALALKKKIAEMPADDA
jgi:hypothetical protein